MTAAGNAPAHRLLALDTAGSACSVAIWAEGAIRAHRFEAMARGQSEHLIPMIEAVMAEAGIAYRDLDAIAVTLGPGGFTGVRIGLATARALALAWARPVIGISNFEAVAAAVPPAKRRDRCLAVLIDAKREDLFAQAFDADLAPRGAPRLILPRDLDEFLPPGPLVLAGDAVPQAARALRAAGRDLTIASSAGQADAAWVATLAADRPLPQPDAPQPRPIYLRAPDVTVPGTVPGGNAIGR